MKEREYYRDASSYIHAQVRRRRQITAIVTIAAAAIICAAFLFVWSYFRIKNVTVTGADGDGLIANHYEDIAKDGFIEEN